MPKYRDWYQVPLGLKYGTICTLLLVTRQGLDTLCSFPITVNYCGGTLNALSGEITSPNYPGTYRSNRDCTWKIVIPAGNHLQLTFKVRCSKLFRRFINFVSLAYLLSRSQIRYYWASGKETGDTWSQSYPLRKKSRKKRGISKAWKSFLTQGIRILESVKFLESWTLESGIRNPESGIEVKESGILNPSSTDKDWNPSLKFRILDRLVIPHTGRALPFTTKPSYGEIFCHPNF